MAYCLHVILTSHQWCWLLGTVCVFKKIVECHSVSFNIVYRWIIHSICRKFLLSICPTWVSICLEIIWRHNDVYRADSLRHPLVIPCYDTWGFLKFKILISNFTTHLDVHRITNELHQAFSTVGFVYLKNHGIDREKVHKNFLIWFKFL